MRLSQIECIALPERQSHSLQARSEDMENAGHPSLNVGGGRDGGQVQPMRLRLELPGREMKTMGGTLNVHWGVDHMVKKRSPRHERRGRAEDT